MNVPAKPTSTTAIVSLVSGILGWTFVPVLGSVLAIICGHMARSEIRRSNGTIDGDGMAIAGLILGWASVAMAVLAIVAIVLFFGGLAAFVALVGANAH